MCKKPFDAYTEQHGWAAWKSGKWRDKKSFVWTQKTESKNIWNAVIWCQPTISGVQFYKQIVLKTCDASREIFCVVRACVKTLSTDDLRSWKNISTWALEHSVENKKTVKNITGLTYNSIFSKTVPAFFPCCMSACHKFCLLTENSSRPLIARIQASRCRVINWRMLTVQLFRDMEYVVKVERPTSFISGITWQDQAAKYDKTSHEDLLSLLHIFFNNKADAIIYWYFFYVWQDYLLPDCQPSRLTGHFQGVGWPLKAKGATIRAVPKIFCSKTRLLRPWLSSIAISTLPSMLISDVGVLSLPWQCRASFYNLPVQIWQFFLENLKRCLVLQS